MVDIDHARFDRVSGKGREDGKKNWLLARAPHGMAQPCQSVVAMMARNIAPPSQPALRNRAR